MSADKQKKKQRAFKFLRDRRRWIRHDEPQEFYFTGPPDGILRWLVKKGFGVIRRQAKGAGPCGGRNVFTELG